MTVLYIAYEVSQMLLCTQPQPNRSLPTRITIDSFNPSFPVYGQQCLFDRMFSHAIYADCLTQQRILNIHRTNYLDEQNTCLANARH